MILVMILVNIIYHSATVEHPLNNTSKYVLVIIEAVLGYTTQPKTNETQASAMFDD